jgi:cell division protein FtsL
MIKPGLVLPLLALALACGVYALKAKVRTLEHEVRQTTRQIADARTELHQLRTEWALLTRPDRIGVLAARHLDLEPPEPMRLVAITDIPFRSELRQGRRTWLATLPSGAATTLRLKPAPGLQGLPPPLRIEDLLE